jgi:hypothetical protein
MRVIEADNVNGALRQACDLMETLRSSYGATMWRRIAPRDGLVTHEFLGPVATVYRRPWRRVLLCPQRDANPFFHLMESLWMLAGRDDAEWISQFSSRISQFAETDGTFWGAYGYRWRRHFEYDNIKVDQLSTLIMLLRKQPDTRRAVLTMWDPLPDLGGTARDIPCNTHIYFKIREDVLHMTVCCRSNDIILGCYGANAVHFSVLQEYVASAVGVRVGTYTQFSDSWHVYEDNPFFRKIVAAEDIDHLDYHRSGLRHLETTALVNGYIEDWDLDLNKFMGDDWYDSRYSDIFFRGVATPMRQTWEIFSDRDNKCRISNALGMAETIQSQDWRMACIDWLDRRMEGGAT